MEADCTRRLFFGESVLVREDGRIPEEVWGRALEGELLVGDDDRVTADEL